MEDLQLLELSRMAYKGEFGNYKVNYSYLGDSLHKYIIETDKYFIIVFRGSKNFTDFLKDLSVSPTEFNNSNVHLGFMTALNAEINPRLSFDKPVYLTGHSLGGALAILEADRLSNAGVDIQKVVTFGSPNVGMLSFKEQYDEQLGRKSIRYINNDDLIPVLPPGYCRVRKDIYIGKKRAWYNPAKYIFMFNDHNINQYFKTMGKIN